MPLHPQAAAFLSRLAAQGAPPLERLTVPAGREMVLGLRRAQGEPEAVHKVSDILVPGPAGLLPVRVYRPEPAENRPPLIVFFHGGGWVNGNLELVDRPLRTLTNATGAIVASVEYRLAPETQFPGPVEDAYSATAALASLAGSLGAEPSHVVVAGESAGANLAAAVALMARDRGQPRIALQLLLYPLLAPVDSSFTSHQENAEGYLLTHDAVLHYWNLYVANRDDTHHPYAAPLAAPDLSNLPPALILTAEFDPVRDEGEEYGRRLRVADARTTVVRYDGQIHGFFLLPAVLDVFRRSIDDISIALSTHLGWHGPAHPQNTAGLGG